MNTIMKLEHLKTIPEILSFIDGTESIVFEPASSKRDLYKVVEEILQRFCYAKLKRQEKGIVIQFLVKITNYSRQQVTRMIKTYLETGKLNYSHKPLNGFESFYNSDDVCLLAELDKRHGVTNGFMVKKLCERAYHKFNDLAYERLSQISVSHIYNIRKSSGYKKHRYHYEKTKSFKGVHIGKRCKPESNGQPGYIRIDTVHQGDLDGCKGVYHINAVDEVTQYEVIVSVQKISALYLLPVLQILLDAFPFIIINFHSDNGSEYVNKDVAELLQQLIIEFTKSRPRRSTDNALVEGKNAALVRKFFGHAHIPQYFAKQLNEFNEEALNPYINYHRPCLYPTTIIDHKGKQKKKYEYKNMMTPYEKFKSLPNAEQYLKGGITFKELDAFAMKMSDNDAADYLQKKLEILFNEIHEDCRKVYNLNSL